MPAAPLPYVDEHETVIAAEADAVWRSLIDTVDRSFSGAGTGRYARLVGSDDCAATGPRPLAEGSTFPGFHVVTAIPGRELALEGRHRFSSYALTFRVVPAGPGRSRLTAETRANFPGVAGGLYRRAVISTGGHAIGLRRLLAAVRRRAE
jgi:hypothetical protein